MKQGFIELAKPVKIWGASEAPPGAGGATREWQRLRCPAQPVADEAGHKRVQRSARREPALTGEAAAGHSNRIAAPNP